MCSWSNKNEDVRPSIHKKDHVIEWMSKICRKLINSKFWQATIQKLRNVMLPHRQFGCCCSVRTKEKIKTVCIKDLGTRIWLNNCAFTNVKDANPKRNRSNACCLPLTFPAWTRYFVHRQNKTNLHCCTQHELAHEHSLIEKKKPDTPTHSILQ